MAKKHQYRASAAEKKKRQAEQQKQKSAAFWAKYKTPAIIGAAAVIVVVIAVILIINGTAAAGSIPMKDGELVVLTAGVPLGISGTTNLMKVHVVGHMLVRGTGLCGGSVTAPLCVVTASAA